MARPTIPKAEQKVSISATISPEAFKIYETMRDRSYKNEQYILSLRED